MTRVLNHSPAAAPAPTAGRPRKYAPHYPAPQWRETPPENVALQIEKLAGEQHMGLTRIAIELGTSFKTLKRWMDDDPTLQECFERGKARAEHELYMYLVDDARAGVTKLRMPVVYALNNRHGWRMEKQEDGARPNVTINLPAERPLSDFIEISTPDGTTARLMPGRALEVNRR